MKRQESCEEEERDDKHVQKVVLGTNTNMGFQFGHLSLWIKLMELPLTMMLCDALTFVKYLGLLLICLKKCWNIDFVFEM
jgi:hypothetical protein